MNERADTVAKLANDLNFITALPPRAIDRKDYTDIYMFIDGDIADLYPSLYIKSTTRHVYFEANERKLHNLWPGVQLDAKKTFHTYSKGLSKINRLDAQSTAEMSFRIRNGSQRFTYSAVLSL